jgi:hypothetical protein
MRDTPAAANNLRKVLARLHRHAIKLGWRQDNPVDATDNFRTGKGFHPWSEAEIDAFDARGPSAPANVWPRNCCWQPRSAGPMRSRLARPIGRGTTSSSITARTTAARWCRWGLTCSSPAHLPGGTTAYLETQFGKPFTSTGFYNWFKRACVKAGIPHCSPHGLRKATSRRLAEAGAPSKAAP